MIANVEIKKIDFLIRYNGHNWTGVTMLDLDANELIYWETTRKVNYEEGETTKIIYSDRFAEQDILSDTRMITDVRRYKMKQTA